MRGAAVLPALEGFGEVADSYGVRRIRHRLLE
jgi:hypothetical protein